MCSPCKNRVKRATNYCIYQLILYANTELANLFYRGRCIYNRNFEMIKYIVLLVLLIFIISSTNGCSPLKGEPQIVESSLKEPVLSEPNNITTSENTKESLHNISEEPHIPQFISATSFHDKAKEILKTYVDDKGMVNYQELRRKRFELSKLLDQFDRLDPNEYKKWSPEDKEAFWINVYKVK